MQQLRMPTRHSFQAWLTSARALLALALALAVGLSQHLHLAGLTGALGLYAATDGVLAALSRDPKTALYARVEAVASFALGLALLIWSRNERALLFFFAMRNLLSGSAEMVAARHADGPGWPKAIGSHAWLGYAGLSAMALSAAFLVATLFGYGALDLHACLAGQLGIWATLGGMQATASLRHKRTAQRPAIRERASWT